MQRAQEHLSRLDNMRLTCVRITGPGVHLVSHTGQHSILMVLNLSIGAIRLFFVSTDSLISRSHEKEQENLCQRRPLRSQLKGERAPSKKNGAALALKGLPTCTPKAPRPAPVSL